jgi:hypothetical protein
MAQHPEAPEGVKPITSIDDPRAIQMLATEHWSLLSARSLAYNEAFTRGGMFLSFLSMSFVGLALLAQALGFNDDFLTITAIVLAFDFVIGATTLGRIAGANVDDLRAMHGMARIRHAYTEAAPIVEQYFTTATHDDMPSVLTAYSNDEDESALGTAWYALTTSAGMIGLITSMVGGLLAAVLAVLLFGVGGGAATTVGIGSSVVIFVVAVALTVRAIPRNQARLIARFPAEPPPLASAPDEADGR